MAISACGNNLSVSGGESSPLLNAKGLTPGNWYFAAHSQITTNLSTNFSGPVTSSDTAVSVATTPEGVCLPGYPTVLSGMVNDNKITLQSLPLRNSNYVMTVTGTSRYGTNLDATYTTAGIVAGRPFCASDVGTVQGVLVPSLSGSWTGTVVESANDIDGPILIPGTMTPMTNIATLAATIVQAVDPVTIKSPAFGSIAVFPLSGTVTYTNSPCYTAGTIDSKQSYIVGIRYFLSINTDTGGTLTASGSLDATHASSIPLASTVSSGVCNYYDIKGTLTNP